MKEKSAVRRVEAFQKVRDRQSEILNAALVLAIALRSGLEEQEIVGKPN
jgi:hypothetical protein